MTVDATDTAAPEPERPSDAAPTHAPAGARAVRQEADGLAALAAALDEPGSALAQAFERAVAIGLAVEGRIIVVGVGKSGHVARKIAATLASTGAPAHFVHPNEASHGDLGMITPRDAVLALSKSGKSAEFSDVAAYTRRFAVPLIAMTAAPESRLATAADVVLVLPDAPEACGETNAPTTSTTMMMALGDALAVALLEARGFSATDFRVFHPGGALGAALARVSDLMHDGDALPLVGLDTPMAEALVTMTHKGFGCAGVVDPTGVLRGIITDGDLRRHMGPDLLTATAGAVMTADPRTVSPRDLAAQALRAMTAHPPRVTVLFALDDGGRPTGIIHMHDCLRAGVA